MKICFAGKLRKYKARWEIEELGAMAFVVMAMETYGAFHKDTESLIQWMAQGLFPPAEGNDDPDGLRSQFTCRFRQRISVAIAKGNYRIMSVFKERCLPGWHR